MFRRLAGRRRPTPVPSPSPPARPSGPLRVATVLLVTLAGLAVVVGHRPGATRVEVASATAWLANEAEGEIARVSGPTAEVEQRLRVRAAPGDDLAVAASGTDVYVLNADRGLLTRIDQLSVGPVAHRRVPARRPVLVVAEPPATGVAVLDRSSGRVHVLDPVGLDPLDRWSVAPGHLTGAFDGDGVLWVADPTTGTVVRHPPDGGRSRHRAGAPGADIEVLVGEAGAVLVLDRVAGRWSGPTGAGTVTAGDWPDGPVTTAVGHRAAPAVLAGTRWVAPAADGAAAADVDLGPGPATGRPVVAEGLGYVPVGGRLAVVDPQGRVVAQPTLTDDPVALSTTVVDGHAFVVADGGASAWVVDPDGRATAVALADPTAPRRDRRGRPVDDAPGGIDPVAPAGAAGGADQWGTRRGTIVPVVTPAPCPPVDCGPAEVICDYGGTAAVCLPCANGGSATTLAACPAACTHGGLPPPPSLCTPCPADVGGDAAHPDDCPPPLVECTHGGAAAACLPCPDGSTAASASACPPVECTFGGPAPSCVPCPSGGTAPTTADCPTDCVHGGTTVAGPCVPCPDGSDAVAGDWCPPACTHGGVPPEGSDCVPCPDGSTAVDPAWCPVPDQPAPAGTGTRR